MLHRGLACCLAFVGLVTACGYRPLVVQVPGGGRTLAVPVVANRTAQGGVTGPLTSALRQRLAAEGIEVRTAGDAAVPRLLVEVLAVESAPGMLERSGDRLLPVDAVWAIEVEARIVDAGDGALAGPRRIRVDGRALSGGGPLAEEALGARRLGELVDLLAERIVARLLEQ